MLGDRGSGKTETAKKLITFLAVADTCLDDSDPQIVYEMEQNASTRRNTDSIRQLFTGFCLREAFGNARTINSHNSSRFISYTQFDYAATSGTLARIITQTLLLEKTRLTTFSKDERNFHIFYQVIYGLREINAAWCEEFYLDYSADSFSILGSHALSESEQKLSIEQFQAVWTSLYTMNCSTEDLVCLLKTLSAILHLGNIRLIESASSWEAVKLESQLITLQALFSLLYVEADSQRLLNAITMQSVGLHRPVSVQTRADTIHLPPQRVRQNVNSLMKYLYEEIFLWICNNFCNGMGFTILPEDFLPGAQIGILDCAGFDPYLERNSLEHLCSNLAAERLVDLFTRQVYRQEQYLIEAECLTCNLSTEFTDREEAVNHPVFDVIIKSPGGIFILLEEYDKLSQTPDDTTLLSRIDSVNDSANTAKNAKTRFAYSKLHCGDRDFVIRHSFGDVKYTIDGFIEKNTNFLPESIISVLKDSPNTILKGNREFSNIELKSPLISTGKKKLNSESQSPTRRSLQSKPDSKTLSSELYEAPKSAKLRRSTMISHNLKLNTTADKASVASLSKGLKSPNQMSATTDLYGMTSPKIVKVESNPLRALSTATVSTTPASSVARRSSMFGRHNQLELDSETSKNLPTKSIQQQRVESSVSYQYRSRLDHLLANLREKELYFFLCVNSGSTTQEPTSFNEDLVLRQITSSGMNAFLKNVPFMENAGLFPVRLTYFEFLTSYCILLPPHQRPDCFELKQARALQILSQFTSASSFQLGKSHVFLTRDGFGELNASLKACLGGYARVIQEVYRSHLTAKKITEKFREISVIQSIFRMKKLRKRYQIIKFGFCLSKYPHADKTDFYTTKWFCARMHRFDRATVLMNEILIVNWKVTIIANIWRRKIARKILLKKRSYVIRIQRFFKQYIPRLWFHNRVMKLHLQCRARRGNSLAFTKAYCERFPHEVHVRNKWLDYCSLLHSAVRGGNFEVVKFLQPDGNEIIATDVCLRNTLHYAAHNPVMRIVRALAEALNSSPTSYYHLSSFPPLGERRQSNCTSSVEDRSHQIRDSSLLSVHPILIEGWVEKSRNGRSWSRKWITVSNGFAAYSPCANPSAKALDDAQTEVDCKVLLLENCAIRRMSTNSTLSAPVKDKMMVVEIESRIFIGQKCGNGIRLLKRSPSGVAVSNSKVYLRFDNEGTLVEWLRSLKKACVKSTLFDNKSHVSSHSKSNHSFTAVSDLTDDLEYGSPVVYMDMLSRTLWVTSLDIFHETPLHSLARSSSLTRHPKANSPSQKPTQLHVSLEAVTFASWLVDNGCNINEQNNGGQTALHLALEYPGNHDLIACLILKGASVFQVRNRSALSVFDVLCSQQIREQYEEVFRVNLARRKSGRKVLPTVTALPSPQLSPQLKYSYCSIFLSTHIIGEGR